MATRIIVSLAIVVAMALTLAPNSDVGGTLSLLLVGSGGGVCRDAKNPQPRAIVCHCRTLPELSRC